MLHYIAACPYCLLSVIAIDIERRQLAFNPGCADNEPCEHLACFHVSVGVHRHEGEKMKAVHGASIDWIWERGSGLRENVEDSGPEAAFHADYWMMFVLDDFRPSSEHDYVWLSAEARERAFPGSGDFEIQRPGPGVCTATLDAFAIFGPDPARILRDVRAGFQVNFGFRNS